MHKGETARPRVAVAAAMHRGSIGCSESPNRCRARATWIIDSRAHGIKETNALGIIQRGFNLHPLGSPGARDAFVLFPVIGVSAGIR